MLSCTNQSGKSLKRLHLKTIMTVFNLHEADTVAWGMQQVYMHVIDV